MMNDTQMWVFFWTGFICGAIVASGIGLVLTLP